MHFVVPKGILNRPENTRVYQDCVERGFGYGKSEYEVSFGLTHWYGELSPSDTETTEPFNSPFRCRNRERSSDSDSTQNMGSVYETWGSVAYSYTVTDVSWSTKPCITQTINPKHPHEACDFGWLYILWKKLIPHIYLVKNVYLFGGIFWNERVFGLSLMKQLPINY